MAVNRGERAIAAVKAHQGPVGEAIAELDQRLTLLARRGASDYPSRREKCDAGPAEATIARDGANRITSILVTPASSDGLSLLVEPRYDGEGNMTGALLTPLHPLSEAEQ